MSEDAETFIEQHKGDVDVGLDSLSGLDISLAMAGDLSEEEYYEGDEDNKETSAKALNTIVSKCIYLLQSNDIDRKQKVRW